MVLCKYNSSIILTTNLNYFNHKSMSNLKKTLSSKYLFIFVITSYTISFLLGGIIGDALKTIGFIVLIMGILALNFELNQKKKEYQKDTNKMNNILHEQKNIYAWVALIIFLISILIIYFFA